jgi:hypothetical protein
MLKAIKHFSTITRHRHKVMINCFRAGIPLQGLTHDLSKYSLTEFIPGVRFYQGNRSPNESEREVYGYSLAWLHHKGRNRHHFEYWNDINPRTKLYEPVEMPIRYVIEMFCDRVAASKIYNGDRYDDSFPLNYYLRGNGRKKMNPATADLLEEWLRMLSQQGEKKTFQNIRRINKSVRHNKVFKDRI